MIRLVLLSLVMTAAAGCVAGQSLQTVYESPAAGESPAATAADPISVQIAVTDDRAFVKSGEKPPYYLGKYRAGFGNPWDVKTENEEPLANSSIKEEMQIKGTLMMGARGGFEREMPKLYSQIIRKIVRDNPDTSAALSTRDK